MTSFSKLVSQLVREDVELRDMLMNDLLRRGDEGTRRRRSTIKELLVHAQWNVDKINENLTSISTLATKITNESSSGENIVRLLLGLCSEQGEVGSSSTISQPPLVTATKSVMQQHFEYERHLLTCLHVDDTTATTTSSVRRTISLTNACRHHSFASSQHVLTPVIEKWLLALETRAIEVATISRSLIQLEFHVRPIEIQARAIYTLLDDLVSNNNNNTAIIMDWLETTMCEGSTHTRAFAREALVAYMQHVCNAIREAILDNDYAFPHFSILPRCLGKHAEFVDLQRQTYWLHSCTPRLHVNDMELPSSDPSHAHDFITNCLAVVNTTIMSHFAPIFTSIANKWQRFILFARNETMTDNNELFIPVHVTETFSRTRLLLQHIDTALRECFEKPHHPIKHEMMFFIRLLQQRICDFVAFDLWPKLQEELLRATNPDQAVHAFVDTATTLSQKLFASDVLSRCVKDLLAMPLKWTRATNSSAERALIVGQFRGVRNFITTAAVTMFVR